MNLDTATILLENVRVRMNCLWDMLSIEVNADRNVMTTINVFRLNGGENLILIRSKDTIIVNCHPLVRMSFLWTLVITTKLTSMRKVSKKINIIVR